MAESARGLQVILDSSSKCGLLSIGIRNLGDSPALDVNVGFDKPFTGLAARGR